MLLNFASYVKISILENENSLLKELRAKQFYKPKGSLLSQLTLFFILLHLRYTPLQACHLLLNKFPSPPILFLNKIQEGHADAMKALKVLKMKDKSSEA